MKPYEILGPDFREWAENIVLIARDHGTAQEEIEKALEQAFNQGYHLGLNKGWAIEQDKSVWIEPTKKYISSLTFHDEGCSCHTCGEIRHEINMGK